METAKVTSKGQVTIPKRVRTLMARPATVWYGVPVGACHATDRDRHRLAFDLDEDGSLHVIRVQGERRPLRGLLSEYTKPEMLDEERVRAALRSRAAAKYTVR